MQSCLRVSVLLYIIAAAVVLKVEASQSPEAIQQLLTEWNDYIDVSEQSAEKSTHEYLSSGDVELGKEVIHRTQEYLAQRQYWVNFVQFATSGKYNVSAQPYNLTQYREEMRKERNNLNQLTDLYLQTLLVRLAQGVYKIMSNGSYNETDAKDVHSILELLIVQLKEMWDKYDVTQSLPFPWKDLVETEPERTKIYQFYVYPVVYFTVLLLGIAGNGTLILIFMNHREVWTAPNIMIVNLLIADVSNLLINAPVYYFMKYYYVPFKNGPYYCQMYVIFRMMNGTVVELSILCLSAQRYFATASALRSSDRMCHFSPRVRATLYITVVWITALAMSVPILAVFEVKSEECFPALKNIELKFVLDLLYCLFDSALLPGLITVFSVMTARLLRRSVKEMPGVVRNNAQQVARYRSARMVVFLAIAFGICFIPRSLWFFAESLFNIDRNKFAWIDEVTNYLMFSNTCVNPIALYYASNTFRRLFDKYLFPWRVPKQVTGGRAKAGVSKTTSVFSLTGGI